MDFKFKSWEFQRNWHAICPKTPGYRQLHAGHGAPGSSCSIYTSCHRCHRSNGSYLQMKDIQQNSLYVTDTQAGRHWILLAPTIRIMLMTESKTTNWIDNNLIIIINKKTLLWCPVYSASCTPWCSNEVFYCAIIKVLLIGHFALKQWLSEETNKIKNTGKYLIA